MLENGICAKALNKNPTTNILNISVGSSAANSGPIHILNISFEKVKTKSTTGKHVSINTRYPKR